MLKNGYFTRFFRALQYNLNFVQISYEQKLRRENDKSEKTKKIS